jgi:hypothetical protein
VTCLLKSFHAETISAQPHLLFIQAEIRPAQLMQQLRDYNHHEELV